MDKHSKKLDQRPDPDIVSKTQQSIRLLNETIQVNANQPSLAMYRIQEHVHKTSGPMIEKRNELKILSGNLSNTIFDIEYATRVTNNFNKCDENITNITKHLEQATNLAKQINLFRQKNFQRQLFEKKD